MSEEETTPMMDDRLAQMIMIRIIQAARERGGEEGILTLLASPQGEHLLEEMVQDARKYTETILSITVTYGIPLIRMIEAGRYDIVSDTFNGCVLPVHEPHTVEVKVHLFKVERWKRGREIQADLRLRGLRPPTLEETLAVGEQHPAKQRIGKRGILALGTFPVAGDTRPHVAGLTNFGEKRDKGRGLESFPFTEDCLYDKEWFHAGVPIEAGG
ncbi:MAG: hypothetical protein HY459_02945 [Parcubacteria group bacterium]|nr:hypothetical protein [Parcubacteria group bacterium]